MDICEMDTLFDKQSVQKEKKKKSHEQNVPHKLSHALTKSFPGSICPLRVMV